MTVELLTFTLVNSLTLIINFLALNADAGPLLQTIRENAHKFRSQTHLLRMTSLRLGTLGVFL